MQNDNKSILQMISMDIKTTNLGYFIYARKSSENDERQIQSIDDQIGSLKSLAEDYHLNVLKIFEERKSAKDPYKRLEFLEMMKRIEDGEANGILCWKYDRLTRNPLEDGKLQWLLQQGIIKSIRTIDKDYIPQDNALLLSIEGGMANQYIRDLSRNVKRGMESKRQKGEFPHKAPTSYLNEDKMIVPDPGRFYIIQKLWKLMLSGNYKISELVKKANDEMSFRTRKTKRMGGKKLTNARLHEIFTNPFYKGILNHDGKEYKLNHKPMVSEDEWERVQILLGRKNKPRRKTHNFTFRGPIFCGECGCLITAEEKPKLIKTTGEIKKYTYYHCTRRKQDIHCSQTRYTSEDELEKQILNELNKFTILPQFIDWALEVLRGSHKNEVDERKAIYRNLEKTYKDIENQLNELTNMKLKRQLNDEEYNIKRDELLKDKSKIKDNIDGYDHRVDEWLELTEKAFNFVTHAREAFIKGDPEAKRGILTAIGKEITLLDGKIHIEPEEWLIPIKEGIPELEKQYRELEPEKLQQDKGIKHALVPIRTAWLGREDSNF